MDRPLDPKDVEAFVAVAEDHSFTAAAKRLGTNQPTISTRVASLEAALGTRLFDRGARRSDLTPAGQVALPRARAILRDQRLLVETVSRFLGEPSGTLEIGASTIPGAYLLPHALADLKRALPLVRVRLAVRDTQGTIDALRANEIEIAVVGREVVDDELECKTIGSDEIVLVASPTLVASRGLAERDRVEISDISLVLREEGSATRRAVVEAIGGVDDLDVVLEVRGNEAVRQAALASLGAAFLSRRAVIRELANGTLVELLGLAPEIERPFCLVTRKGRTLSPPAEQLVAILGEEG